jgi:hypothetical protein
VILILLIARAYKSQRHVCQLAHSAQLVACYPGHHGRQKVMQQEQERKKKAQKSRPEKFYGFFELMLGISEFLLERS